MCIRFYFQANHNSNQKLIYAKKYNKIQHHKRRSFIRNSWISMALLYILFSYLLKKLKRKNGVCINSTDGNQSLNQRSQYFRGLFLNFLRIFFFFFFVRPFLFSHSHYTNFLFERIKTAHTQKKKTSRTISVLNYCENI